MDTKIFLYILVIGFGAIAAFIVSVLIYIGFRYFKAYNFLYEYTGFAGCGSKKEFFAVSLLHKTKRIAADGIAAIGKLKAEGKISQETEETLEYLRELLLETGSVTKEDYLLDAFLQIDVSDRTNSLDSIRMSEQFVADYQLLLKAQSAYQGFVHGIFTVHQSQVKLKTNHERD